MRGKEVKGRDGGTREAGKEEKERENWRKTMEAEDDGETGEDGERGEGVTSSRREGSEEERRRW